MGSLPCPPYGDISHTNQRNGIRLLLEYPLVEEKVAQAYSQTIEPGERIEERIIAFLHTQEVSEQEKKVQEERAPAD